MDICEQAIQLEELLTFDDADYPNWRGDQGKCWVDLEKEEITIVGWLSDKGSTMNGYRLVVQNKSKNNKSGVKKWMEAAGWDDTGKQINVKAFGASFSDVVDVLLQHAQEGGRRVGSMAMVVGNLCAVRRQDPYFGCNDELIFTPKKSTPQKGRPVEIGGKRVQVYLDEASIESAKQLGNDNVSEGIRKALSQSSAIC